MTEVNYLYKGEYIRVYLSKDGELAFIDIYPHSVSLNLPAEKLGIFLEEFTQASVYCKLKLEK